MIKILAGTIICLIFGFFAGFGLHTFLKKWGVFNIRIGGISSSTIYEIIFYDALERSESIQKSRRSLTLAGFTLSSISLLFGMYRGHLNEVTVILQWLFGAIFSLFLSSKFSIEAQYFGAALLAEFLEDVGGLCIIFALGAFMSKIPSLQSMVWLSTLTLIVMIIFMLKALYDLGYMYKHMRKREAK